MIDAIRRYVLAGSVGLVALCLALISGAAPASSAQHIQGDADCSGTVMALDVGEILRDGATLGHAACRAAADVNCDHAVDARDALIVLRYVAGFPLNQAGCVQVGDPIAGVTVSVDGGIRPLDPTEPGLDGRPDRPSAGAIGSDGVEVDFVADEVIYKPASDSDLQAFLQKYGGTVLRDGTHTIPAAATPQGEPAEVNSGYYLIKVDTTTSSTDDLTHNLEDAGFYGDFRFSSEAAERIVALVAREQDLGVNLNVELHPQTSNEEPTNAAHSQWLDAASLSYMTAAEVPRAWDYLKYNLLPPNNGSFTPVLVAVIDTGFALSETTGLPLEENLDYKYFGNAPMQWDEIDNDQTAGGPSFSACSGGTQCPWHGQGSFGVCCARPHNNYGVAGTGGDVVLPFLIRSDPSMYTMADSIRDAAIIHAGVVTVSMSIDCGFGCDFVSFFSDPDFQDAVNQVTSGGGILLAAAGNEDKDISDDDIYPCKLDDVICVGGAFSGGSLTNEYNYGNGVDIWSPADITSTVTPLTSAQDDNDWGLDELYNFGGTSAATPFVAGVVALMKAIDPSLTTSGAQTALQTTSRQSADPKVKYGVVDALKALLAVHPDIPPVVTWVKPPAGTVHGYNGLEMRVTVTDPDPGANLPQFDGETIVFWYANGVTPICASNVVTYVNGQAGYQCTTTSALPIPVGTKSIRAVATDPFGAQGSTEVPITIIDNPPTVQLLHPADGSTFYATQTVKYSAHVFDPDQVPFPPGEIVWTSNLDGQIGTGDQIDVALSPGDHTITVTATDEKGSSAQASLTVHILSGLGVPSVQITAPEDGHFFGIGESMHFAGNASDPEDGPLTGTSLRWYSNIDGFLGSGDSIDVTLSGFPCFTQDHTITLQATDSNNHVVTDDIIVEVGQIC